METYRNLRILEPLFANYFRRCKIFGATPCQIPIDKKTIENLLNGSRKNFRPDEKVFLVDSWTSLASLCSMKTVAATVLSSLVSNVHFRTRQGRNQRFLVFCCCCWVNLSEYRFSPWHLGHVRVQTSTGNKRKSIGCGRERAKSCQCSRIIQ